MAGAVAGGAAGGPWGALIGAAVGLVKTAMDKFKDNTEKAADALDEFTKRIGKQLGRLSGSREYFDDIRVKRET